MKKGVDISIYKNSKNIKIKNVKKLSELGKVRGLMFRKKEKCPALLFEFENSVKLKIHSFFVFFPFAAVWLDDKNNVIDMKIVRPFRISVSCREPFYKLLEIPINKYYKKEAEALFKKL